MSKYYGLYGCIVVGVDDSRQDGKIQVTVNGVGGSGKYLARICSNCAYDSGGDIAIPKIGETGYVMFENGELQKPVYMGNTFQEFKTPLPNYDTKTRVISWDSCRIEMKDKVMKFIVGEKALITITGDAILFQVGNNQEGTIDNKGENAESTDSQSQDNGNKKGLVTVTESGIEIKVGDKTSISATEQSAGINSVQVAISGKTQTGISATGELSLRGNHIGLNDGAAIEALSATPITSAISTSGFTSSFADVGVNNVMNGGVLDELTSNLNFDTFKNLGIDNLSGMLDVNGLKDSLGNFDFAQKLDGFGSLGTIFNPDTLTNFASNSDLLGGIGGIDKLNEMLSNNSFSDLGNLDVLKSAIIDSGGLEKVLNSNVLGKLQTDENLLQNLGKDKFKGSSFNDIIQIPEVEEFFNGSNMNVTEIFNDKGIDIVSRNEGIIKTFIDENFKKTIEGDKDFEVM